MNKLIDVRRDADLLSEEERIGLAAHLLASCPSAPLGPSDEEVDERERQMDVAEVQPISHEEFVRQVGRA